MRECAVRMALSNAGQHELLIGVYVVLAEDQLPTATAESLGQEIRAGEWSG